MTAKNVKAALRKRHGCDGATGEWVCVEEAFSGWHTATGGIDLLAIGCWSSAKAPGLPGAGRGFPFPRVAYEVKVSRADMRRELDGYHHKSWRRDVPPWPGKAQPAINLTNFFMFAVPKGMLKPEELARREPWPAELSGRRGCNLWVPAEAGLVEVDDRGCRVVHKAPSRAVVTEWDVAAVAELLRHGLDPNRERSLRLQNAYLRGRVESLERTLTEAEAA